MHTTTLVATDSLIDGHDDDDDEKGKYFPENKKKLFFSYIMNDHNHNNINTNHYITCVYHCSMVLLGWCVICPL